MGNTRKESGKRVKDCIGFKKMTSKETCPKLSGKTDLANECLLSEYLERIPPLSWPTTLKIARAKLHGGQTYTDI